MLRSNLDGSGRDMPGRVEKVEMILKKLDKKSLMVVLGLGDVPVRSTSRGFQCWQRSHTSNKGNCKWCS